MTSKSVSPKVIAGGAVGALVTIVTWFLGIAGLDVPVEVAAALATVLSFIAGYFVPDPLRAGKHADETTD